MGMCGLKDSSAADAMATPTCAPQLFTIRAGGPACDVSGVQRLRKISVALRPTRMSPAHGRMRQWVLVCVGILSADVCVLALWSAGSQPSTRHVKKVAKAAVDLLEAQLGAVR